MPTLVIGNYITILTTYFDYVFHIVTVGLCCGQLQLSVSKKSIISCGVSDNKFNSSLLVSINIFIVSPVHRALLGDEKAKLGLSFLYDAPPGLNKKEVILIICYGSFLTIELLVLLLCFVILGKCHVISQQQHLPVGQ